MLVLCAVAGQCFNTTIISPQRDLEPECMIARQQVFKHIWRNRHFTCCSLDKHLNLLQESRLFILLIVLRLVGTPHQTLHVAFSIVYELPVLIGKAPNLQVLEWQLRLRQWKTQLRIYVFGQASRPSDEFT